MSEEYHLNINSQFKKIYIKADKDTILLTSCINHRYALTKFLLENGYKNEILKVNRVDI